MKKSILSKPLYVMMLIIIVSLVSVIGYFFVTEQLLFVSRNPEDSNYQELATVWAHALQTRDGQPRYNMMDEKMKMAFIEEQKNRAGENWNFNIGFSSPRIDSFTIEWQGTLATITYQTSDSGGGHYIMTEQIAFTKVADKWLVTSYTLEENW